MCKKPTHTREKKVIKAVSARMKATLDLVEAKQEMEEDEAADEAAAAAELTEVKQEMEEAQAAAAKKKKAKSKTIQWR